MTNDVAALYRKYGPMVFRRCRKMLRNEDEAKDAVQDVFLNLIKTAGVNSVPYPSSYLYTSATNVCLNRIRDKKWQVGDFYDMEDFPGNDDGYEQINAKLLIQAILQDESEDTRAICYMRYFDKMTLEEIGENMGISKSTVEKRLATFKKRAFLKLEKDNT